MSTSNIYWGSRGDDFRNLIKGIISKGVREKYVECLMSEDSMKLFGMAFTASSADMKDNYERFEQLGDVTANKFIVWYAYRRFPQLDCTGGVKIVARLKINYGAKVTFAKLAENLGFWNYISAAEEGDVKNMKYRLRNKKDLLEDTLESFVGCIEYILDKEFMPGVGYGIVYTILADIFDKLDISLRFEDLYDAKTRLKETFDLYKNALGTWMFIDYKVPIENSEHRMAQSYLYRIPPDVITKPISRQDESGQIVMYPRKEWIQIGAGEATTKGEAQKLAAEIGIATLKSEGFYREPPSDYQCYAQDSTK